MESRSTVPEPYSMGSSLGDGWKLDQLLLSPRSLVASEKETSVSSKKILVLGDRMTDRYIRGPVTKLSPEAPVPVVGIESIEDRDGAAANVRNNILALGCPCFVIYGKGKQILKARIIGDGHHVVRIDHDHPQEPITVPEVAEFLPDMDIVLLIDYNKGSLRYSKEIVALCKEHGKTVLVDPKGHDWTRYHGADLIKPNVNELREAVGGWGSRDEMIHKAQQLREAIGIPYLLVTLARDGMVLIGEHVFAHPADCAEPVDVSGAGEATIAAFACAMARGETMEACVRLASKAAGICVSREGTTVVTAEEVFE